MRVAVIGAGKMGLPLACQIASRGASVIVCDTNPRIVDLINQGHCPLDEPGLPGLLERVAKEARLRAWTDTTQAVSESEVVITIVPVMLTSEKRPELSLIESVTREIAAGLKPGMMISYETTLPVGGTRRLGQILETSGWKAGDDFDLVFSPERVKSRFVLDRLAETPKMVGGLTPAGAERAARFYADYLGAPTINLGSLEASEFAKLAGMVYRDVNIALSNELARYAELAGIDFGPVMAASNTDGETSLLHPGIGVGGHCTPVYPYFLIHGASQLGLPMHLPRAARAINDGQVAHAIDRLEQWFKPIRGIQVTILGLGFRPGVKEHTCSPAFLLRDELEGRGAKVKLHDPLYDDEEVRSHGFEPGEVDGEVLILSTAHEPFRHLNFEDLAQRGLKAVVDGRNLWCPEEVCQAGVLYIGIGKPAQGSRLGREFPLGGVPA